VEIEKTFSFLSPTDGMVENLLHLGKDDGWNGWNKPWSASPIQQLLRIMLSSKQCYQKSNLVPFRRKAGGLELEDQ